MKKIDFLLLYVIVIATWIYLFSLFGINDSVMYLLSSNQYEKLEGNVIEIEQVGGESKGKVFVCKVSCSLNHKSYILSCRSKDYIGEKVKFYVDKQGSARWIKPYMPKTTGKLGALLFAIEGAFVIVGRLRFILRRKTIKTQVLYKVKKMRKDYKAEYAVCIWKDEKGKDHLFKTYIGKYPIMYEVKDEVSFLVDPWNYHNYDMVRDDRVKELLKSKGYYSK